MHGVYIYSIRTHRGLTSKKQYECYIGMNWLRGWNIWEIRWGRHNSKMDTTHKLASLYTFECVLMRSLDGWKYKPLIVIKSPFFSSVTDSEPWPAKAAAGLFEYRLLLSGELLFASRSGVVGILSDRNAGLLTAAAGVLIRRIWLVIEEWWFNFDCDGWARWWASVASCLEARPKSLRSTFS